MGYPRHLHVPPNTPGTYHCTSRCVRRAFLCGQDHVTARSFDHRKQWLEQSILQLANIFAVAVHAYSVMSNHFHVVVETDPIASWQWSDDEVARRWLSLTRKIDAHDELFETRVAQLVAQAERLAVLRERLGSLSWYMRYLKEPIARRANKEDGCSGRFWEGRFRTQALLDDAAVLACMVYVDLNPIRAGIADSPTQSPHTSARARSRHAQTSENSPIQPLASSIRSHLSILSSAQYLQLLDWTGHTLHPNGPDTTPGDVPPTINRLGLRREQWCIQVSATESHYWRAIGHLESLLTFAKQVGLKRIRGIGTARRLQRVATTT